MVVWNREKSCDFWIWVKTSCVYIGCRILSTRLLWLFIFLHCWWCYRRAVGGYGGAGIYHGIGAIGSTRFRYKLYHTHTHRRTQSDKHRLSLLFYFFFRAVRPITLFHRHCVPFVCVCGGGGGIYTLHQQHRPKIYLPTTSEWPLRSNTRTKRSYLDFLLTRCSRLENVCCCCCLSVVVVRFGFYFLFTLPHPPGQGQSVGCASVIQKNYTTAAVPASEHYRAYTHALGDHLLTMFVRPENWW